MYISLTIVLDLKKAVPFPGTARELPIDPLLQDHSHPVAFRASASCGIVHGFGTGTFVLLPPGVDGKNQRNHRHYGYYC